MPRKLFTVMLLATVMVMSVLIAPSEAAAPSKKRWLKDTRTAMYGSRAFINSRLTQGGTKLAVNFDIDNTSLATYYRRGKAVPVVLRFAKYANKQGVAILFNTGRTENNLTQPLAWLRKAGYPVSGICARHSGEGLVAGKQRCRQQYVDAGYTLIANIGNRSTDFEGGNYERAFRLPSYGKTLG